MSTLISCIYLAACERDMRVSVDGRNPPTFKLSGSGNLISFVVMEVPPHNQTQKIQRESDRNTVLWRIRPELEGNEISRMPEITYGKVPRGFVQEFPVNGTPTHLTEGKVYEVGGTAYNANGGFIWIRVEDDKVIEVPIPGSAPAQ
ncbi:MAG TPA: hypothetical protein VJ023_06015 [Pyrinomonadaceae bacterium]|nr:hypothetical protein [Pyrinomonadaceae bacterium]